MPARWKDFKKERRRDDALGDGTMVAQIALKYNITPTELAEFAEFMEVDIIKEPYLLPIVAEAVIAPLPLGWIELEDEDKRLYFCDTNTQKTQWEHPLDKHFKNELFVERKKYKARAKGNQHEISGSDCDPQPVRPSVAAQATELYFKAQIQDKDARIQTLQAELEDSSKHQGDLKQLQKAKESRLLREQNSKLQKEVDGYRKKAPPSKSSGWLFGKKSAPAPAHPEQEAGTTDSAQGKPGAPASGARRGQLEREWLWRLRSSTRDVKHDVMDIKKDVQSFKLVIEDWNRSTSQQIKFALQQLRPDVPGEQLMPARHGELVDLRAENSRLEQVLATNAVRDAQRERLVNLAPAEADKELQEHINRSEAEIARLLVMLAGHEQADRQVQDLLSSRPERIRLPDNPDGTSANAPSIVKALLALVQELEEGVNNRAQEVDQMSKQRDPELNGPTAAASAAFQIERKALLGQLAGLKSQLEQEQSRASHTQASEGELAATLRGCRDDLAAAHAQIDVLKDSIDTSSKEKDTLAKESSSMRSAHQQKVDELGNVREQLQESTSLRQNAQKEHDVAIAVANQELSAAQAAKSSLEQEWRQQVEQMKAREQKAAQECERMFKLVQQAHEKVTAKEKDFQAKLKREQVRFETEMETKIADRMVGVQAKYEEEARARRKWFNLVQELQGNIRVYCRVRPRLQVEVSAGLEMGIRFAGEHSDIVIQNPQRGQKDKRFEFEKVLQPDLPDVEVFNAVSPLVTSVLDGYKVCIFAYGQTGSGKTYTMEGPRSTEGIYYRSMQQLFQIKADREAFMGVEISVNLLEIYNESIIDLLSAGDSRQNLEIRRGPQGVFVPGLTEVPVRSAEHVIEVLVHGNQHRSTAKTSMNDVSSRSHSLLVVNVVVTRPATKDHEVSEQNFAPFFRKHANGVVSCLLTTCDVA